MKKCFAVVILLALLSGCAGETIASPAGTGAGRYFAVYNVSRDKYSAEYKYFIYARDRTVLDSGVTRKYPEISYPDISRWNGFIKLCMYYFGAGGDECRYYDIDNRLVSELFWYPVGECDKLLARVDDPAGAESLIVQSIFDATYYREFPLDFLQGWGDVFKMRQQTPVVSLEFSDDEKQLRVTYEDEDGYERTETLDLY